MGWELGTNDTYLKRFFADNSVTTARVRGVAGSWKRIGTDVVGRAGRGGRIT